MIIKFFHFYFINYFFLLLLFIIFIYLLFLFYLFFYLFIIFGPPLKLLNLLELFYKSYIYIINKYKYKIFKNHLCVALLLVPILFRVLLNAQSLV